MKLALAFSLVASAAAFSQSSRREAIQSAAAVGAAFLPVAANAAVGESPRFSVFGLIGDGSAYSESAAYGTDQAGKLYSPYSVYGEAGSDSLYKPGSTEYVAKKKAVLAETKKRLAKIPAYADKKKWFEVYNELDRYMYETRGAALYLAKSPAQKKAATDFFKAIEKVDLSARRKNKEEVLAAAKDAMAKLDALTAGL